MTEHEIDTLMKAMEVNPHAVLLLIQMNWSELKIDYNQIFEK